MNSLITGLESIAPRLGMTLMHSLWQGAVVAIALAAILRLLRNAVVRYAVCCWAMVLFVALVALTFLVLAPAQPQVFTVAQTQAALSPMNFTIVSPAQKTSPVPVEPIDPMRWAGIVWLLGALVVAMWHLAGWLWIRRCVQGRELNPQPMLSTLAEALGIHRTIRLIETSRLNVPAVVGVFRPVILLPLGLMNDLPPEQIEAILIHELAHIRRHDYLVNLLQVVVESLLFYHPAMWWISSQIRREREHCCDDIAASRFTAGRYVSALLALEQRRSPRFHAAVAATGGTLLERARRLLGREADANRRPFRSAVAALIVLACVVVPVVVVGCKKQPSATSSARASSPAAVAEVEPQASGITDEDLKPDYSVARLGANDLVQVSVMELMGQGMESKEPRRISDPEGTILMPMIPKPLKIAGLTEVDASGLIARAYSEAQIIHDPQVSVLRLENRSATYAVLGSGAARPGEYAIDTPDFRLTKALAFAGARLGGQTSVVIVRNNGSGKNRRLVIPTAQLIAGDASVNVVMRAGDTVVLFPPGVPTDPPVADAPTTAAADLGQYYVGGPAVKRPGVYTIPPRNISVCQAIIAAGLQGDEEYVEIGRRDGGKAEWFMHGKYSVNDPGPLSGVLLQPKDTVMVKPTPFESATTQAAPAP